MDPRRKIGSRKKYGDTTRLSGAIHVPACELDSGVARPRKTATYITRVLPRTSYLASHYFALPRPLRNTTHDTAPSVVSQRCPSSGGQATSRPLVRSHPNLPLEPKPAKQHQQSKPPSRSDCEIWRRPKFHMAAEARETLTRTTRSTWTAKSSAWASRGATGMGRLVPGGEVRRDTFFGHLIIIFRACSSMSVSSRGVLVDFRSGRSGTIELGPLSVKSWIDVTSLPYLASCAPNHRPPRTFEHTSTPSRTSMSTSHHLKSS